MNIFDLFLFIYFLYFCFTRDCLMNILQTIIFNVFFMLIMNDSLSIFNKLCLGAAQKWPGNRKRPAYLYPRLEYHSYMKFFFSITDLVCHS